jgi:hypothetical protein
MSDQELIMRALMALLLAETVSKRRPIADELKRRLGI